MPALISQYVRGAAGLAANVCLTGSICSSKRGSVVRHTKDLTDPGQRLEVSLSHRTRTLRLVQSLYPRHALRPDAFETAHEMACIQAGPCARTRNTAQKKVPQQEASCIGTVSPSLRKHDSHDMAAACPFTKTKASLPRVHEG